MEIVTTILLLAVVALIIVAIHVYSHLSLMREKFYRGVRESRITPEDAADILLWDIDTFKAEYKMWVEGEL